MSKTKVLYVEDELFLGKIVKESLETRGFLALGSKEHIKFSSIGRKYDQVDVKEKIWRKLN